MLRGKPIKLSIFAFLLLAVGGWAQDKTSEAYPGVAVGTGGSVGGKSIQFDFRVTQYTTDEDVQKFAELVKNQGTDALRRALEKENKGRIAVVGSTGNQIAIARQRTQGAETIITVITARTMPFVELYRNGRTTDYPFGYLQVKLDAQGNGSGQIMAAAKIRLIRKVDNTRLRASATSTSRPTTSGRRNDGVLARILQSGPQFRSLSGESTKPVRNLTRTRYDDLLGLSASGEGRGDHTEPMVLSAAETCDVGNELRFTGDR